jgi:hypothetical protein
MFGIAKEPTRTWRHLWRRRINQNYLLFALPATEDWMTFRANFRLAGDTLYIDNVMTEYDHSVKTSPGMKI